MFWQDNVPSTRPTEYSRTPNIVSLMELFGLKCLLRRRILNFTIMPQEVLLPTIHTYLPIGCVRVWAGMTLRDPSHWRRTLHLYGWIPLPKQREDPPSLVPSTEDQVDKHLQSHTPRKSDIYIIWIGSNDALQPNVTADAGEVARRIEDQLSKLYKKGT